MMSRTLYPNFTNLGRAARILAEGALGIFRCIFVGLCNCSRGKLHFWTAPSIGFWFLGLRIQGRAEKKQCLGFERIVFTSLL